MFDMFSKQSVVSGLMMTLRAQRAKKPPLGIPGGLETYHPVCSRLKFLKNLTWTERRHTRDTKWHNYVASLVL